MIKKFWNKFKDPLEYFKLKSFLIMLGLIIVLVLERRYL